MAKSDSYYKNTWNNGKTCTIRVPLAIAKEITAIARAIDEQKIDISKILSEIP